MFCAPEVLRGHKYNESADTFSFALTLVACFKKGRAYDHTESFRLNDVKVCAEITREKSLPLCTITHRR